MRMSYTVSRFCPCTDGEIIGDFKAPEIPVIECKLCDAIHYFERVMRWDTWNGNYWEEWVLKRK